MTVKNKVKHGISSLVFCSLVVLSANTFADELIKDTRINLGLTSAEKAAFLSEMRQMLTSIQGVIEGIGENNPEIIIKAARYSGNRMARATPKSVKKKTPAAFQQIGGPTHMLFEELVVRAESDDMESLTVLTGEIMKNCLACHEMFKVSE